MKHLYPFFAFVLVQALGWGLAWLGGYDFDGRGFWVAYGAALILIAGVGVAVIVSTEVKDGK